MKHVAEYRLTFAFACRIVIAVLAYFRFRRSPPPEFGHGQRTIAVTVGILQQFGGGTLSGTRWRYGPPVFPENMPQVFLLSPCVTACGIGRKADFAAGWSGVSVRFSAPQFLRQTVSGRFQPLRVWLSIAFPTVCIQLSGTGFHG